MRVFVDEQVSKRLGYASGLSHFTFRAPQSLGLLTSWLTKPNSRSIYV